MNHPSNSPIAIFFYEVLLSLYPREHRKEYGDEMRLLFRDLYQEEHDRHDEIGIGFWFRLTLDVIKSTFVEHILLLKKIGFENYAREIYHLDRPFFVGFILIFPSLLINTIDDVNLLLLANNNWLKPIFESEWGAAVFFICYLFLPLLALLLSMLYIGKTYKGEKHKVISLSFLAHQFPRFVIIFLSVLSILLVIGHDTIPCAIQMVFSKGLLNIGSTLQCL